MSVHRALYTLAVSVAVAGCGTGPSGSDSNRAECVDGPEGLPSKLACTGLYADGSAETLTDAVAAYDPSLSMWADGAEKRRFIRVPSGTVIDTSDMDHWVFPVGTKLWKEFSFGGRKIETRYEEKREDGTWSRTTYVWSDDQTSASEVTGGVTNVAGSGYDVPAHAQCSTCHRGASDGVLGFEAISLSTPHATGLTMDELVRRGLVSRPPMSSLTIPGTPTESAALGWLHANCGNSCHNRTPPAIARSTGLFMRLSTDRMASVQETDAYVSAVGVPSAFQPSSDSALLRIAPRDVAHSAVPYRALARDSAGQTGQTGQAGAQMPPIATHVPDMAGVALVDAWINAM